MDEFITPPPPPTLIPDRLPVPAESEEKLKREKRWPYPERPPREYPVVEGVPICERCQQQHVTLDGRPSCTGHRKQREGDDGQLEPLRPCRDSPKPGLTRCRRHGGGSRQAKMKSERFLAEKRAAKALAKVKVKPIGNPLDELAELAAESVAAKDHFANVVSQLKDQYRFVDEKGAEQLDARVGMYERALDRAERFLQNLAKIGFEEQRLRLDERRAENVRVFITGVIEDLGLRLDAPEVRAVLSEWMPVLDGEPAPHRRLADVDETTIELESEEVSP